MDMLEARIAREITPERRRELDEFAKHKGLKLTNQELREWDAHANRPLMPREKPTASEQSVWDEMQREITRIESYAPTIALEVIYVERVTLRLQEEKTQQVEDLRSAAEILPPVPEADGH